MDPIDKFEGAVKWFRRTGPRRGIYRCEAHDDKSASGSYSEADDGRLLIYCFAGCPASDVVGAVGLTLSDLFPERQIGADHKPPQRRPIHAEDTLKALGHEMTTGYLILRDAYERLDAIGMDARELGLIGLSPELMARLLLCVSRCGNAVELSTGADIRSIGKNGVGGLSQKEETELEAA